jgi:hypothetical protein
MNCGNQKRERKKLYLEVVFEKKKITNLRKRKGQAIAVNLN